MNAALFRSALAFLATAGAHAQESRPPNVVFILADDLGYGDLGVYGQRIVPTPNLDRLAAEGTRFTQCYAGSTVCAPSRCVLMTGLHTGHCRIRGNKNIDLAAEDVTVAEVLAETGYATALVGKWGLGTAGNSGIPTRQGFAEFYGFLSQRRAHNYYPAWLWRGEAKASLHNEAEGGIATKKTEYAHDLFTDEALRRIDAWREQTFFLYLAYTVPHANNELGKATRNGMEVPDYGPFAVESWPDPEKGRAAMIHRLDQDVGRIVARIDELGLRENTLILFTSDNGPHREGGSDPNFFGARGGLRGIKRSLHDGGIRVPMIARWPKTVPADRVSDYPWSFVDVLPTLADLAGAKVPAGLDGHSIAPTLRGQAQEPPAFQYWEFHERGFHQAVRMGRWKAVRKPDAALELYDLDADRSESRDLRERHPDVVAQIEEYLKTARTESEDFPVEAPRKR